MAIALSGKLRESRGKGASRQIRREGRLPAVLYGRENNVSLTVNPKELKKIVDEKGINTLMDLSIEGDTEKKRTVIVKDHQEHPLKDGWVHIDFYEIDMTAKIKVQVPILLEGHSPGEKLGGLVEHSLHELEVRCLPGQIPHDFKVDMAQVQLDQVVHVSDLVIPEGIEVITPAEEGVVSVHEVKAKAEPAPGEGLGEGEIAEPALVTKKAEEADTKSD